MLPASHPLNETVTLWISDRLGAPHNAPYCRAVAPAHSGRFREAAAS